MENSSELRKSGRTRKQPDWFSKHDIIPWPVITFVMDEEEEEKEHPTKKKRSQTKSINKSSRPITHRRRDKQMENNLLDLFDQLEQLGHFNIALNELLTENITPIES